MNLGLYVHFPFCGRKCDYCSFFSVPILEKKNEELIEKYYECLLKEIENRRSQLSNFHVDSIYLGGGTPSILSPQKVDQLLSWIQKHFKYVNSGIEITIECNPRDFSEKRISDYRSAGINRVVLGVQTLNPKNHSLIGRSTDICDNRILSIFRNTQDIAHCVDLIVGIPGQREHDLEIELNQIINYNFEHISAYILSIEKGTPLSKRINVVDDFDDKQRSLLEKTIDIFRGAGYTHYEVSNYALPSYESKHNMKYWKFAPYAGFGVSAHSFYNSERFYNLNSITKYIKNNGNILQKDNRTENSEIVEYILSGMRLTEGISFKDFDEKLGISVPEELMVRLFEMKKNGQLEIINTGKDTNIRFSRNGFFEMDRLIFNMTEMFL